MTDAPTTAGMPDPIHGTPQMPVGAPEWCAWATTEIERLRTAQPSAGAEPVGVVVFGIGKADLNTAELPDGTPLYTHPAPVQPDSGGVVEALREAIPDLSSVIAWLDNGCDPKHAADELRIYKSRIDYAALAPVAAEGGEKDRLREALSALLISAKHRPASASAEMDRWIENSLNPAVAFASHALRIEPTGETGGAL